MNTYGVDLMGSRRRRRHSAEFKAAVVSECIKPGVSIAAVALAHSLNANMLRKWLMDGRLPTDAPGAAHSASTCAFSAAVWLRRVLLFSVAVGVVVIVSIRGLMDTIVSRPGVAIQDGIASRLRSFHVSAIKHRRGA